VTTTKAARTNRTAPTTPIKKSPHDNAVVRARLDAAAFVDDLEGVENSTYWRELTPEKQAEIQAERAETRAAWEAAHAIPAPTAKFTPGELRILGHARQVIP
jgi:hypothetical protein